MKATHFWMRTSLFLFALVVDFLGSRTDPLAAPLASQDRLQPYAVAGTAAGEGQILSYTVNSPTGQAAGYFGYATTVGDVNNDGKADIVVGAPSETVDGHVCQGQANVLDVLLFKPVIGSELGDAKYNRRYDLDVDGKVSVLDVLLYKPVLQSSCTQGPQLATAWPGPSAAPRLSFCSSNPSSKLSAPRGL